MTQLDLANLARDELASPSNPRRIAAAEAAAADLCLEEKPT